MIPVPSDDEGQDSPNEIHDETVTSGSESDDSADPSLQRPSKLARMASGSKSSNESADGDSDDDDVSDDDNDDVAIDKSKLNKGRYFGLPDISTKCYRCGQVGHIADMCENEEVKRPCYLCGQVGHESRDCKSTLCFRCNRLGHKAAECTERRPVFHKRRRNESGADLAALMLCINCAKPGHMFCDETVISNFSKGPDTVYCCKCGSSGHHSADCTHVGTSGGGQYHVRSRAKSCVSCGLFGALHTHNLCWACSQKSMRSMSNRNGGRDHYSSGSHNHRSSGGGRSSQSRSVNIYHADSGYGSSSRGHGGSRGYSSNNRHSGGNSRHSSGGGNSRYSSGGNSRHSSGGNSRHSSGGGNNSRHSSGGGNNSRHSSGGGNNSRHSSGGGNNRNNKGRKQNGGNQNRKGNGGGWGQGRRV